MTDNSAVQATDSQLLTSLRVHRTRTISLTGSQDCECNGEDLEPQEPENSAAGTQTTTVQPSSNFIASTDKDSNDILQDAAGRKVKRSGKRTSTSRKTQSTVKSLPEIQHIVLSITSADSVMNPARLFVASLGNPPPYSSTRHSAGHILLKALSSQLCMPSFQKSKSFANGLTSIGADVGRPEFTLWQSPSLMNVSGVALLKAYKHFASTVQISPTDPLPGLIVLYDEMETTPAQLRLRRGATSAKGHNGLKSVQQSLQSAGLMDKLNDRFVKIGIGIGRPAGGSRTSEDVSQYVLGQVTAGESNAIDAKIPELIRMLDSEVIRMSK